MNPTFLDYQVRARETAIYDNGSCPPLAYCGLKLAGESGEVSEKIGKLFRDREGKLDQDWKADLMLELGDVLWYISAIASEIEVSLADVAMANIAKLKSRQERNKLKGSGDNR